MTSQTPSGGVQGLPTSNMALVSLIAGILGLSVPILGSIVAAVTGQMARREIRESAGTLGGDGLVTAGLVMGWIGIGLAVATGFVSVGSLLRSLSVLRYSPRPARLPVSCRSCWFWSKKS